MFSNILICESTQEIRNINSHLPTVNFHRRFVNEREIGRGSSESLTGLIQCRHFAVFYLFYKFSTKHKKRKLSHTHTHTHTHIPMGNHKSHRKTRRKKELCRTKATE